jgi:hypothetical protein
MVLMVILWFSFIFIPNITDKPLPPIAFLRRFILCMRLPIMGYALFHLHVNLAQGQSAWAFELIGIGFGHEQIFWRMGWRDGGAEAIC